MKIGRNTYECLCGEIIHQQVRKVGGGKIEGGGVESVGVDMVKCDRCGCWVSQKTKFELSLKKPRRFK